MGPVIEKSCEQWHGLIAMRSLGGLSGDEVTALEAHLEGCAECRSLAEEMSSTVAMLAYVDPTSVEPTAQVAPELAERVLGDLHRAGAMHRRRRRVAASAVSFVGALAAALILFALLSGTSPSTTQRTLALGPTAAESLTHNAVTAKAVLVDQSWGTSVDFSEQGLPGGSVYTVSMKTAAGTWWTAGTYRSISGRTVSATMACAVAMKDITGLRVVNAKGVTVLTSSENSATY
jgi:predicted anti-sigma-YlaC factor YlaD